MADEKNITTDADEVVDTADVKEEAAEITEEATETAEAEATEEVAEEPVAPKIKSSNVKHVWKETYHSKRSELDRGTVADKDSLAELSAQQEQLTNICYNRAYKIMKSKVENAQELLQSCKKVLSRRMQETELTRMGGSGR